MNQFEQVKTTYNEMLTDRGFSLSGLLNEEHQLYDNDDKQIVIFKNDLDKLNIDYIKEYIKILSDNKLKHAIIIYKNEITPSAKKVIQNLFQFTIEMFKVDELMFNLTKHRLYNKHIRLNDDDKKDFIKKYGVQIPVILVTDPVSRYFNFKKGDIIKIERKNDVVSYRIVR